jgi:hypothetical protein
MLRRAVVVLERMHLRRPAEDDWRAIQARLHWQTLVRALLGACLLAAAAWLVFTKGVRPTRSDIDAQTLLEPKRPLPFRPPYPVDAAVLAGIDMAAVHGRLIPAWVISLEHSPHTLGHWDEERAFRALCAEAGKDPNLALLLDQLHDKLMDGAYEFGGEIRALVKGWNDVMTRGKVPFRLEYHIEKTAHGPEMRVRTYRAVADLTVTVEHAPYRVLFLSREDRTNLVEGFFGQTSTERDAALVVTDRIADYAIDRLWPLLDVDGELVPSDTDPALLAKVRGEARAALGDEMESRLARASSFYRALETELSSLPRRRGCGASVVVERVPWDGLSDRTLAMINGVARRNEERGCPRLTALDAERLSEMSQRLRGDPAFEEALRRLAAWLSRAVAIHEAQHLADDHATPEGGAGPCRACPASMRYGVQSEVSAYLASFAAQGVGYVALYQACGVDARPEESHAAALAFLMPKLLPAGCDGPVPDDLYGRARALSRELFGRDEAVTLPDDFPVGLPVRRAAVP